MSERWISPSACCFASFSRSGGLSGSSSLASIHSPSLLRNGDLRGRSGLEQASFDEQHGAIANAQRLADGVIADEHSDAALAQCPDQTLQLVHRDRIEPGERLVEEQEARV